VVHRWVILIYATAVQKQRLVPIKYLQGLFLRGQFTDQSRVLPYTSEIGTVKGLSGSRQSPSMSVYCVIPVALKFSMLATLSCHREFPFSGTADFTSVVTKKRDRLLAWLTSRAATPIVATHFRTKSG
jgi:hypothetical protein